MPWFAKYDGVDGDVSSSKITDGTSNTLMIAEQNPALGGPDTFSLGGPDTFALGGPDTFSRNSGGSTDGGYVLTSVSHAGTLNAPDTDWLVS
jgi:hypothetical protein